MRTAVYPGTFDPVTNGHLDIVQRAARLFDKVIIAVAAENYKDNLFSLEERTELVRTVTRDLPTVYTENFDGLLMDFVKRQGAVAIVRGLRAVSDFEYEFKLSMMNKKLAEDVETIFLMTASEYSFLSSSIIKQVFELGARISGLVPVVVEEKLRQRFDKSTG